MLDHLKTQTEWKNLHAEILAETDPVKVFKLRRSALTADYFLTSVAGISEEGDLVRILVELFS
jgi:hypothetical protein